jgi:hypothetical protein
LHVLSAPLTFVLSQDQTLQQRFVGEREPEGPLALGCSRPGLARAAPARDRAGIGPEHETCTIQFSRIEGEGFSAAAPVSCRRRFDVLESTHNFELVQRFFCCRALFFETVATQNLTCLDTLLPWKSVPSG